MNSKGEITLKATSLLYLKDALAKERFEECAELSALAKENGANQGEINKVIARHIRSLKGLKGMTVTPLSKGRKRF